jgi:predicted transposase YbfD/YdcC
LGVVLAVVDVAHKTNEITQLKPLLDPLDLTGWVVTLDALHCQRRTARYLVEDKNAAYVFTAAKDNQPTLVTLPWTRVPITHTMRDRGHGRDERRTNPGHARTPGDLPPRRAGVPDRTLRPRPGRRPDIRGRSPLRKGSAPTRLCLQPCFIPCQRYLNADPSTNGVILVSRGIRLL